MSEFEREEFRTMFDAELTKLERTVDKAHAAIRAGGDLFTRDELNAAVSAERQACAAIADEWRSSRDGNMAGNIAADIRARRTQ